MAICNSCRDVIDVEDICRTCMLGDCCCICDEGTFDEDEFGEEPEAEYERRTRG